MHINNHCLHSDNTAWCKNKNIKRSLFGIGARCCKIYPYMDESKCEFFESNLKGRPKSPIGIRSSVVRPPIKIQVEIVSQSST